MKIGPYISQLLPDHDTVIIPGFGAFITSYKPAEIDEQGENIEPPSKTVSFTTQFKNNDGLLVGFVADRENISHFEALQKIENERDDFLYRLDKGEKVVIESVGVLYYDESHTIQFELQTGKNLNLDSFGLGATSLSSAEEEPENEKQEEAMLTAAGSADNPENTEEPEFEPVEKTEPWYVEAKDRKKRNWLWLVLILIPLVGAGIYIFLFTDKKQQDTIEVRTEAPVRDSQETDVTNITADVDSGIQDSAVTVINEGLILEDTAGIELDSSKYYLIAGSFKEQENAEEYLQELKNEGYNSFRLGKRGNFYLIGIDTYDTENAAFAAQQDFLSKNPDSGAWIYHEE